MWYEHAQQAQRSVIKTTRRNTLSSASQKHCDQKRGRMEKRQPLCLSVKEEAINLKSWRDQVKAGERAANRQEFGCHNHGAAHTAVPKRPGRGLVGRKPPHRHKRNVKLVMVVSAARTITFHLERGRRDGRLQLQCVRLPPGVNRGYCSTFAAGFITTWSSLQ